MVHIIDGNAVAATIRKDLKTKIDTLRNSGVTPGLVRLSVGIEHIDDILSDIGQALDKC